MLELNFDQFYTLFRALSQFNIFVFGELDSPFCDLKTSSDIATVHAHLARYELEPSLIENFTFYRGQSLFQNDLDLVQIVGLVY